MGVNQNSKVILGRLKRGKLQCGRKLGDFQKRESLSSGEKKVTIRNYRNEKGGKGEKKRRKSKARIQETEKAPCATHEH